MVAGLDLINKVLGRPSDFATYIEMQNYEPVQHPDGDVLPKPARVSLKRLAFVVSSLAVVAIFGVLLSHKVAYGKHRQPIYSVESLTRDVQIKPLHSHNDYWRARPLFDALSAGAVSVEADIWHFPDGLKLTGAEVRSFGRDSLYVGHSLVYLKPSGTLDAMYLDPIFALLQQANPARTFANKTAARFEGESPLSGVFFDFPEQTLHLWLDIKLDADETYRQVRPLLQRFIDRGYLTHYNTSLRQLVWGPVAITLTGNLPVELVKGEKVRYVFLDGPLALYNLSHAELSPLQLRQLAELSIVASGDLGTLLHQPCDQYARAGFTENQLAALRDYADTAHRFNLKTRIWGGVNWPNQVKLAHYRGYYESGIDLLNADDLQQLAKVF